MNNPQAFTLTLGDFEISNKDGKTTVSFRIPPSNNPIDFVKHINESQT